MTNLRPGLGSCTPNWGSPDDRDLRDFFLGPRPRASRCGTRPTLTTVGLAPRPVTEALTSNPMESVLDCTHFDGATKKRLLRPDDRVKTN